MRLFIGIIIGFLLATTSINAADVVIGGQVVKKVDAETRILIDNFKTYVAAIQDANTRRAVKELARIVFKNYKEELP